MITANNFQQPVTLQIKVIVQNRTGDNIASLVERQLQNHSSNLDYFIGEEYLNGVMVYLTVPPTEHVGKDFFKYLAVPFKDHIIEQLKTVAQNMAVLKLKLSSVRDVEATEAVKSQAERLFKSN